MKPPEEERRKGDRRHYSRFDGLTNRRQSKLKIKNTDEGIKGGSLESESTRLADPIDNKNDT